MYQTIPLQKFVQELRIQVENSTSNEISIQVKCFLTKRTYITKTLKFNSASESPKRENKKRKLDQQEGTSEDSNQGIESPTADTEYLQLFSNEEESSYGVIGMISSEITDSTISKENTSSENDEDWTTNTLPTSTLRMDESVYQSNVQTSLNILDLENSEPTCVVDKELNSLVVEKDSIQGGTIAMKCITGPIIKTKQDLNVFCQVMEQEKCVLYADSENILLPHITHCCIPNSKLVIASENNVYLQLMKDVKAKESITIDFERYYKYSETITPCMCSAASCRVFIERDVAEELQFILKNLQPMLHVKLVSIDPIFSNLFQANGAIILQKLNDFRLDTKAQESLVSVLVALGCKVIETDPVFKIYQAAKDPTLTLQEYLTLPNNKKCQISSWISKRKAVGQGLLILNEAILNTAKLELTYTGSFKKLEAFSRKLISAIDSTNPEHLLSKIRLLYLRLNT